jgi:hypothetical protein
VFYGAGLGAVAGLTGRVPAPVVLAAAGAAGCCTPLLTGGLTSLLSDLLPPTALSRAFSLDAVSYNLAGIAGPALASLLATTTGPACGLAVLGAGAVAGGLLVFALPLRPRTGKGASLRPAALGATAVLLVRHRQLRSLTWASAVGQLGVGALPVVCVLFAARYRAPWAAGGLLTAMALGSLAGSLAYAWRPWGTRRPERTMAACLLATAVPLAAVPSTHSATAAAGCFALAGCCTGPLFAALLAGRDRYAPDGARTQVFTLGASIKSTFAAGGAALAGAWQAAGPGGLVLAAAGCQAAAAALGMLLLTGTRPRPARPAHAECLAPLTARSVPAAAFSRAGWCGRSSTRSSSCCSCTGAGWCKSGSPRCCRNGPWFRASGR